MKKKKKTKKIVAAVIVGIIVLMIVVNKLMPKEETKPVVTVEKVSKGDITCTLSNTGTVSSETNTDYISPVSASVETVNVSVGQSVKAGDYILSYNTEQLKEAYDLASLQNLSEQATADDSLNVSSKNEQALADANSRINTLNSQIDGKKGEITNINTEISSGTLSEADLAIKQNELESKTAELQDLQGQLTETQADKTAAEAGIMSENQKKSIDYNMQVSKLSVTNAENDLENAKAGLVAECDGIVTAVNVANGSMTTAGETLVTIASTSNMKVDFKVSKYNLSDLQLNQSVKITVLGKEYTGTVSRISKVAASEVSELSGSSAGSASAMVSAEVHIDNPDDNLIIGIDADLQITTGEASGVLLVPASAVNEDKKGTFIYKYEKGKVVRKPVTIGLMSDDKAEVKEGLAEGDVVVSEVDASVENNMEAETSYLEMEE